MNVRLERAAFLPGKKILQTLFLPGGTRYKTAASNSFLFLNAFVLNAGEDVKIMCEFNNSSSQTATAKARLRQKQMCYTHGHGEQRQYEQTLARQAGLVGPHSSEAHSELTITIPSTAPFTISNCAILEVTYVIEVSERMVVMNVL